MIKKFITKGIASGVGAVAEARAERKERKASAVSGTSTGELSNTTSRDSKKVDDDSSDSEDEIELAWELDEASEQLQPPTYDESVGQDLDSVVQTFLRSQEKGQPLPGYTPQQYKPLSAPVILPQRRPKNKQRGFVRAYPPILEECAGIDQHAFFQFLTAFDKASKASPVYDVINLASFAVGLVPNPIAMAVSIAVTTANKTAQEIHSRFTRNRFLDDINEKWLKPKGLYCMIMTFKPDAPTIIETDVTSTDQALARYNSEDKPEWRKNLAKIRLTSGKTRGEQALPEAAPLIYPAIDAAAESTSQEKQNFLKSSGEFMGTYLDRRAQAMHATDNPDSKLAAPEAQRQFKSKYADPNHPIHSGTVFGLLTAGKFDPVRSKRRHKAQRRAVRRGIQLNEEDLQAAEMGKRLPYERGGRRKGVIGSGVQMVRKTLQQDLLYLTIVNLPSDSELAEIRQELERAQSK
jgi:hypothetical protein